MGLWCGPDGWRWADNSPFDPPYPPEEIRRNVMDSAYHLVIAAYAGKLKIPYLPSAILVELPEKARSEGDIFS